MVDENRSGLYARERAIGADRHCAQVVVIADARHDEILPFGGSPRRRRGLSLEFLGPRLSLGRRAVVDRHLMAAFDDEMSCHGKTHDAETEKSDFGHV